MRIKIFLLTILKQHKYSKQLENEIENNKELAQQFIKGIIKAGTILNELETNDDETDDEENNKTDDEINDKTNYKK